MPEKKALELLKDVDAVYTIKGKKVIHTDLKKDAPAGKALSDLLLGPTGNLRAPTARIGSTLLVGFDPETYRKLLTE